MKITSVVVTYNRKELLYKSLKSILNQELEVNRIIVVNNCSTDGTSEMLEDKFGQCSKIKVVNLTENIGGAGGFKKGIESAMLDDSEWISISDDDAILSKHFFKKIKEYGDCNPNVKCFSGSVYENGKINTAHRGRLISDKVSLFDDVSEEEYNKNFELDIVSFVGLLVNKEVIKQIGLPRQDYFIWYDDVEYSMKIREKFNIINVSEATIYHEVGKELIRYSGRDRKIVWKDYYGYRNRWSMMQTYSKDKAVAHRRIKFEYYKALIGSLLKKRGDRGKIASMRLVYDAYKAFNHGVMGVNVKYLP